MTSAVKLVLVIKVRQVYCSGLQKKIEQNEGSEQESEWQKVRWLRINEEQNPIFRQKPLSTFIASKPTPLVSFCGEAIERLNAMKYLGIMFNRSLEFKDYVDRIIQQKPGRD